MKKTLLLLLFITFTLNVNSQTFVDNYITYEVISTSPNEVKTINYDVAGGNTVTIPSTATRNVLGGGSVTYNVTSIGTESFKNKSLTSVSIPSSIITIEAAAFRDNQLTGVIIPESVINIENEVFSNNSLTSVTALNTAPPIITTGGSLDTFGDRSGIDLFIPPGTTGIYATDTGALWTGFNNVLEFLELGDTFVENYITYEVISLLPNEVKTIDYNVSGGNTVVIPTTITSNGTIYTITEIGDDSFKNKGLNSVTIPNTTINIGSSAFQQNNLTTIIIPEGVESIDFASFNNNQLTSVVIPNSITTMGSGIFGNNQITSVVFPDNITVIPGLTFSNNNLPSVVIPDGVTEIGGHAFSHNQLTSVTIPDGVELIGNSSFEDNQLTSVIFPSSITLINTEAFRDNQLINVTSLATTAPWIATSTGTSDTFGDRSSINLHIPTGTMGSYVTDSGALWIGFNTVTEDAVLNTVDFELDNNIQILTTPNEINIMHSNKIRLQNYSMYDISGSKITEGTENVIAIHSLTSGIYILKLNFINRVYTKKVVVN